MSKCMSAVFLTAMVLVLNTTSIAHSSTDNSIIVNQYAPTTTYAITRKGKRIGTHEVRFTGDNSALTVTVKSRIRVTVLKIPVFVFEYDSTELWKDGVLVSATSEVQENDKLTKSSMLSDTTKTLLNGPRGKKTVERLYFTSNHWNPAVIETKRLFNTLSGTDSSVNIAMINDESKVNELTASQYRYSGDIEADTWYSSSGKWLKLQFKGKDGSLIEYTIED